MSEEKLLGRICTKLTGREGNRLAVIVDVLDGNFVIIDGQVKRRRCNLAHLELSAKQLNIKKGISTEELKALLKQENIINDYTKKEKQTVKPKKQQAKKQEPAVQAKKQANKEKAAKKISQQAKAKQAKPK